MDPQDDFPPITVVTRIDCPRDGFVLVRGVATDNYDVKHVLVNSEPARATADNFAEWEIELPVTSDNLELAAHAEDVNENVETLSH